MRQAPDRAILPDPPEELKALSRTLQGRLRERIGAAGFMPFSEYMEAALYEPGLGYYSAGSRKFGAGGDFVTAPELGRVFAGCLARQLEDIAGALGNWDLLEIGAGTGALAADLLGALGPDRAPRRYRILERSADLRAVQEDTLRRRSPPALERVKWIEAPPEKDWQGVVIANEVIDALPVECFRLSGNGPERLGVACGADGFEWAARPAGDGLTGEIHRRLGSHVDRLPAGYRSELCLLIEPWLAAVSRGLRRGAALFIDYGYPRTEYYLPERTGGTLVCHYRHRAHDDPFWWPGLQDLSAFVDFTAVAEAGAACGFDLLGYTTQAQFLIGCGLQEEIAGLEDMPDRERLELATEVRELMLPGAMGERFQCMALGRDIDLPLRGFAGADLRRRL